MSSPHPPIFILFKPQLGENIGAVARAMSNFGLADMRIVAPRDGWPNEAADAMAAHGKHIIEQATIFETLAEACHDITHLYATSARERAMDKPVFTPREAIAKPAGKTAILFGPERSGLANEEIVVADAVITVPVSDTNPSLNLAQSSVIIGYEWFLANNEGTSKTIEEDIATKQELDGFFEHLKPVLDAADYFREPNREGSMWLTLKHLFTRMQPSAQEIKTLRGVLRSIQRKINS